MCNKKETYIVRTLRLMNYLIQHGFYCYKIEDDECNPEYKVFCFDKTDELLSCISNYTAKKSYKR